MPSGLFFRNSDQILPALVCHISKFWKIFQCLVWNDRCYWVSEVVKKQQTFEKKLAEEKMKSSIGKRKIRAFHKAIGSIVCVSIAFNPAYGLTLRGTPSVVGSDFSGGSSVGSLNFGSNDDSIDFLSLRGKASVVGSAFSGGSSVGSLNFGSNDDSIDFSTGKEQKQTFDQIAPKPGVCPANVPTKFGANTFKKKDSERFRAPILNDIGPCDTEKVNSCLDMMARSLSNSQQALVGFDEQRDEALKTGSSLRYTKDDVLTIQSVLKSWTDFKSMAGKLSVNRDTQLMQAENEKTIEKILDRSEVSGESELNLSEQSIISGIHLNLSEELAVASEASLDPHFSDYAGAPALLASLNPSASAAFSCLIGFKKSDTEILYGKKRVIVGYFSGTKYAEIGDSSKQNAVWAAIVGALVASIITGIVNTANETRKMEHDSAEREKQQAHDSAERAKDRALEREKAGLPPEQPKTDTATGKTSGSDSGKTSSGSAGQPKTIQEGAKPKEDDMFKPFPGSDYDPKDNKHYDMTLGCDSDMSWLDRSDPKKNPELVLHYANPNDILGIWDGGKNELAGVINRSDLYTDYANPADFAEIKKHVISIDDFRKPSLNLNKECARIRTTEGGSGQELPDMQLKEFGEARLEKSWRFKLVPHFFDTTEGASGQEFGEARLEKVGNLN
jgi:hypothetical protein